MTDTFNTFVQETFVLEPGAGPMTRSQIRTAFNDWNRVLIERWQIKPRELIDRIRVLCDSKSTDDELWGIRLRDQRDDATDEKINELQNTISKIMSQRTEFCLKLSATERQLAAAEKQIQRLRPVNIDLWNARSIRGK